MAATTEMQLVGFRIGDESFAAPISKVQEIIRNSSIVKIPKAPDFVEGVINLRGNVICVIDLRKRFGMQPRAAGEKPLVIIAEVADVVVGLQVDSVSDVFIVKDQQFQKIPSLAVGIDQKFIHGIVKRDEKMIIVVDIDRVLAQNESDLLRSM
jgi:purine-binding chemotaxis protein CheW